MQLKIKIIFHQKFPKFLLLEECEGWAEIDLMLERISENIMVERERIGGDWDLDSQEDGGHRQVGLVSK